jgi:hypothetical protein
MTEITNNELIELKDTESLVAGEVYKLTDYSGSFPIYMTAIDEKTFEDESYTDNQDIILHYDLDQARIDYMKDNVRRIEGNFDWSNNIEGEVSDIYFENANLLHVKDSSNVVCEDSVGIGSTVSNSSNIIIGDGATVSINNSLDIVVGGNSTVNISGSTSVTIGERNTLTITDTTAISVGDDNENVILGNYNKIGSRNRNVALNGENNIIKSDDYNLIIEGDLNEVNKSRFVNIGGSFNDIEKSNLIKLNNAVGNKIANSSSADVVNTNNNIIAVRNIIVQDKPAFLQYSSPKNSNIKRVKNLIEKINLQSDNEGRTLIIDQNKFYQETGSSGTKNDKKYEIVDGIWTEVKKGE